MKILGIETSCDETSVAVVEFSDRNIRILSHEIASQTESHRPYGGVVPEVATRQHLKHLNPMVPRVLAAGGMSLKEIDGIAVTRGPGLASSLMVGLSFAKGLAFSTGKPWVGVNHLEGHLFSAFLTQGDLPEKPHLGLIVSGGHTQIVYVKKPGEYDVIGSTQDDAAGEAFDKVAKLLGLPYPGGPEIEKKSRSGKGDAIGFPRAMLHKDHYHFSFSGLKTAVRVYLQQNPSILESEEGVCDVCASFQAAVVDVLLRKTMKACQEFDVETVTLSGGVSCNGALRAAFQSSGKEKGLEILLADPVLSTDNAAMIAAVGGFMLRAGRGSEWAEDVDPNLKLY